MSDQVSPAPADTVRAVAPCGHDLGAGAGVTRRRLVAGTAGLGAACLLAACGSGAGADGSSPESSGGESSSGGSGGSGGGSSTQGVPASDLTVGGGVVVGDVSEPYVVTQPSDGSYKAFSAVCTHAGCTVARVEENRIICTCHGSEFDAETGENVVGPSGGDANLAPLAEKQVSDEGGTLVVGA